MFSKASRYFWFTVMVSTIALRVIVTQIIQHFQINVWYAVPKDVAIIVQVHDSIPPEIYALPVFKALPKAFTPVEELTTQPISKALCVLQSSSVTTLDWLFLLPAQGQLEKWIIQDSAYNFSTTQLLHTKIYELPTLNLFATSFHGVWIFSKRANLVESALKQLKRKQKTSVMAKKQYHAGFEMVLIPAYLPAFLSSFSANSPTNWMNVGIHKMDWIQLQFSSDSTVLGTIRFSNTPFPHSVTHFYYPILPEDIVFARALQCSRNTWANQWKDKAFRKLSKGWWEREGIVGYINNQEELSSFWVTRLKSEANFDWDKFIKSQNIPLQIYDYPIFPYYSTAEGEYFTIIEQQLIACKSATAIEHWIDKYVAGQTIAQLPIDTNQFQQPLLFIDLPTFYQLLSRYVYTNDELIEPPINNLFSSIFVGSMKVHRKSAQLKGRFLGLPSKVTAPKQQWKFELDTSVLTAPQYVNQHIFVQDQDKRLYCLNKDGTLRWKKELESNILSSIVEAQESYLFNTANFIYRIDHEGGNVNTYPLRLLTPATTGLTFTSFDNGQLPVYFVACENGGVYAYNLDGQPITGWNPVLIEKNIQHPIQHFQVPSKDFILIGTDSSLFIFNRDGVLRWAPYHAKTKLIGFDYQADDISKRIVTIDDTGYLLNYNLEGKLFKLAVGKSKEKIIGFVYADSWGDTRKDYHILRNEAFEIYAYDEKNTFDLRYQRKFEATFDTIFELPTTKGRSRIGILSKQKEIIKVLDTKGEDVLETSLKGNVPFILVENPEKKVQFLITCWRKDVLSYQVTLSSN